MLRLGPLPIAALEAYLEASGLDGSEARLRAALAGGSVGKALAFASEEYRALRDDLLGLLEGVGRGGGHLLEGAERLADNDDAALALTALRSLLRDASALRLGADPASLLNADVAERIAPLARGRVGERAPQIAEAAARARAALRGNANRLLTMDLLVDSLA
jgi:hypothetical protein